MLKVGGHVSIAGGHSKAIDRTLEIGGNCAQIFLASPRGWNFAKISDEEIDHFRAYATEHKVSPIVFHASYLVNLADDDRIGKLSVQLLTHELKTASRMGVIGSVIHLGSYKDNGKDHLKLCKNIASVLEKIPDDVQFIIENAGNRKIGKDIEEIAEIMDELNDDRVRVCLDTCHLHAAGYDLGSEQSFSDFMKVFDEKIGVDRIAVWHINDSRDPFGSLRDRHENIGEGNVGTTVFRNILTNPKTRHHPMILEVPGFDGTGPDKRNVDLIKKLSV